MDFRTYPEDLVHDRLLTATRVGVQAMQRTIDMNRKRGRYALDSDCDSSPSGREMQFVDKVGTSSYLGINESRRDQGTQQPT